MIPAMRSHKAITEEAMKVREGAAKYLDGDIPSDLKTQWGALGAFASALARLTWPYLYTDSPGMNPRGRSK